MKEIKAEDYDTVIDKWKEWQSTPWNRLSYLISRKNLQNLIIGRKVRILDVGGGNGANSIYFASRLYQVIVRKK